MGINRGREEGGASHKGGQSRPTIKNLWSTPVAVVEGAKIKDLVYECAHEKERGMVNAQVNKFRGFGV